jgi:hypothetical protein
MKWQCKRSLGGDGRGGGYTPCLVWISLENRTRAASPRPQEPPSKSHGKSGVRGRFNEQDTSAALFSFVDSCWRWSIILMIVRIGSQLEVVRVERAQYNLELNHRTTLVGSARRVECRRNAGLVSCRFHVESQRHQLCRIAV